MFTRLKMKLLPAKKTDGKGEVKHIHKKKIRELGLI